MDTTEIIPADPQQPLGVYELGAMSTQSLRSELARSLTMTAKHLAYLAGIWKELESRGEDLSDLRLGLAAYLPQIASGRLSAEAVLRFAGQPTVLRNVSSLPVDEQQRLAGGGTVQILTVGEAGQYDCIELSASSLTAAQARMVIGDGRLRTADEQRAMLESARMSAAKRARPGQDARVRYDAKTDRIRVGSASASVGEIQRALADASPLSPEKSETELASILAIKLTEAEHRGLKIRAAQADMTLQSYVRAVIVTNNLL